MKPARIVFPGFWFGESDLKQAEELARRGVGGFCLYGATAREAYDFTRRMRDVSPYDHLLFCADIDEDLNEIITDAPSLPSNVSLSRFSSPQDGAYRKGNLLARMAVGPGRGLGVCFPGFLRRAAGSYPFGGRFYCGAFQWRRIELRKVFSRCVRRFKDFGANGRCRICAL